MAKNNKSNKMQSQKGEQPQKVFNLRFFITYTLLFISTYMMMKSCERQKQLEEKAKLEQKRKDSLAQLKAKETTKELQIVRDSAGMAQAAQLIGDFSYNLQISDNQNDDITVETDLIKAVIARKGGYFKSFELKKYKTYDSLPLYLVHNNSRFNLKLKTKDGKEVNTELLDFHPSISKDGKNTKVSMKLYAGAQNYLEYIYTFKPDDYMIGFVIRTNNMENILQNGEIPLHWEMKAFRHEKSISYENRFVTLKYEYEDGKDDYLSAMKDQADDEAEDVNWVDYKQHFFSSFLITPEKAFEKASFKQINLAKSGEDTLQYTKHFFTDTALKTTDGNLNYPMKMFYGPNDYKLLESYQLGIEKVIPLGWGIFGWVNKWLFMPLFAFLSSFIGNYGIVIILMTIIIRLLVSPLTYKTYLSQAKSKILKPEIEEINKKYKDNPAKRQKEVMALQSKAGVSPLAGCIPSLLFIPIFYALFRFFPAAIGLRQKGFLWADDLSAYDSIAHLPFKIPMYGDHVSLLALLASITMFIYMKMNASNQTSMPSQEGMPDMQKMMKWMIYLSPVMLLFFFNSYASGLSLYYFISNLMTIVILVVIKKYVIDEQKIKAVIEENKKRPKKQGRFAKKMAELMEKAEEQKRLQEEMKRKQKNRKR